MSDTNLDKLPKLTGSNYRLWVDQIKNVLMMSQLWMIVSGIETCPPEPGSKPTDVTSKEFPQWKRDRKEYMVRSPIPQCDRGDLPGWSRD